MDEHSVFPIGKENIVKEFSDSITRWLENTKHYFKPLTKDEILNLSAIKTIIELRTNKIRDELIVIRTLADENSMKSKQKLTNLIKELK